ncbi:hypothetical protein FGO68_gene14238 [Halteria grandinella]|uniref:Uncharacterized protein n=1 Tax=Halteria grandinella TaxID=5974 RepID=A0A8J8P666_HALGN|nr:hypothetical protein FGO68_gene14238 [Halteria grandinella]
MAVVLQILGVEFFLLKFPPKFQCGSSPKKLVLLKFQNRPIVIVHSHYINLLRLLHMHLLGDLKFLLDQPHQLKYQELLRECLILKGLATHQFIDGLELFSQLKFIK